MNFEIEVPLKLKNETLDSIVTMSYDHTCASTTQCTKWAKLLKMKRLQTVKHTVVSVFGSEVRHFVSRNTSNGRRLFQIITGTMFDPHTGKSSDSSLYIKFK